MRFTTGLVLAAALMAGGSVAKADVYSVTTSYSGSGEIFDTFNFYPATFDTSKGTLSAVSLNFQGDVQSTETGHPAPPLSTDQTLLEFRNYFGIVGDGFSLYTPLATTYGLARFHYVGYGYSSVAAPFNLTFSVPKSDVIDYADCTACIVGDVRGGATFFDAATERPFSAMGTLEDELTSVEGSLTETFTYDPVHVPEPGSLALLGTAGIMLVGAIKLTRRRRIS